MLAGGDPADLVAGAVAALAATWASLRLLPPGTMAACGLLALAGLALRFLRQSVVAGVDVARRALDPRLPLRPGFVVYPVGLPPGRARNMFCTLTSLLPGTVPTGADEDGALLVHCLDVEQPVAAQLAAEEALFMPGDRPMAEFLLAAAGFVLAMVALGLVRILRGPSDADRIMAAQLLGTGGIAALLLLAAATGVPAAVDVALVLALARGLRLGRLRQRRRSTRRLTDRHEPRASISSPSWRSAPAPSSSWRGPSGCCGFPTRSPACTP